MYNLLVSIIIPIYKVEPYIERCVKSVLAQHYRPLEVILINDGSPDASEMLAKKTINESSVRDIKFLFVKHEYNRGLSAARNTGLDVAKGNYIYFLDSDDEILPDCISKLAAPLEKYQYDFIIGNYRVEGTSMAFPPLNIHGECKCALTTYDEKKWFPMAWNKLVRLSLIKKYRLYFTEGLIHEDELWSYQLACTSKIFYAIKETTYIYQWRGSSIMGTETPNDNLRWRFRIAQMMWEYIDRHELANNIVANDIIEHFVQATHPLFIITPHMEGYHYYRQLRQESRRKLRTYWSLSFTSKAGFMKYAHYLLPIPIGFIIKTLARRWRK